MPEKLMIKVRCSCGTLLSVADDQLRFRCPKCQRILKLPKRAKMRVAAGAGGPAPEPDPERAEDEPGTDESPSRVAERPADHAAPMPVPSDPEAVDWSRWPRGRLVARIQLGVLGALLIGIVAPLNGDTATWDALLSAAGRLGQVSLRETVGLLIPIAGAMALVGSILPIRRARGVLVTVTGAAMLVMAFGHLAVRYGGTTNHLGVHVPALLGFGVLAAGLGLLLLPVTATRFYAPGCPVLRKASIVGGVSLCVLIGLFTYAHHELVLGSSWSERILTVSDSTLGRAFLAPSGSLESMHAWVPGIGGICAAGLLLFGVLSVFGFSHRRWVAGVTGAVGQVTLLIVPVWALGFAVWGGADAFADGRQLLFHIAWVFAPLLLCAVGLRDFLGEHLRSPETEVELAT